MPRFPYLLEYRVKNTIQGRKPAVTRVTRLQKRCRSISPLPQTQAAAQWTNCPSFAKVWKFKRACWETQSIVFNIACCLSSH